MHKLVLVEPAGGIASPTAATLSFMDEAMLTAVLQPGQAEWAGLATRRDTLDAVRAALRGGVHAVNLCTLDGLARELYTYEGSGTLFTREDYCRIERLGIDDFEEVERLIARGQREGYLKPRTPAEVARILHQRLRRRDRLAPFRRRVRPGGRAYRGERVGEIVGLYTITRFKGEGVGGRLVGARARGGARARAALRVRVHDRRARAGVLRAARLRRVSRRRRAGGEVDRLRAPAPARACKVLRYDLEPAAR